MSSPGGLRIHAPSEDAVITGASCRFFATRFHNSPICDTSIHRARSVLIELDPRRARAPRYHRIVIECVQIVPILVNRGTPRTPDSLSSIARLPGSIVISACALEGRFSQSTYLQHQTQSSSEH